MATENLKAWAVGKPLFLVLVALRMAPAAEIVFELLESVRGGDLGEASERQRALKEWLRLYRGHRKVEQVILTNFDLNLMGISLTQKKREGGACGYGGPFEDEP